MQRVVLVEEEVEEKDEEKEEEQQQRQLYLRLELRRSFRFVSARVVRLHTSRAGAHLWCLLFGAALMFYYSLLLTFGSVMSQVMGNHRVLGKVMGNVTGDSTPLKGRCGVRIPVIWPDK